MLREVQAKVSAGFKVGGAFVTEASVFISSLSIPYYLRYDYAPLRTNSIYYSRVGTLLLMTYTPVETAAT